MFVRLKACTVCSKTKVTEISTLLFCKVFIEPSVYLFYIIVWHIVSECWVCVNNYGSHNKEGFYILALFPVIQSWVSE